MISLLPLSALALVLTAAPAHWVPVDGPSLPRPEPVKTFTTSGGRLVLVLQDDFSNAKAWIAFSADRGDTFALHKLPRGSFDDTLFDRDAVTLIVTEREGHHQVWRSTDEGRTWSQSPLDDGQTMDLSMPTQIVVRQGQWFVGAGQRLWISADRGGSWQEQSLPFQIGGLTASKAGLWALGNAPGEEKPSTHVWQWVPQRRAFTLRAHFPGYPVFLSATPTALCLRTRFHPMTCSKDGGRRWNASTGFSRGPIFGLQVGEHGRVMAWTPDGRVAAAGKPWRHLTRFGDGYTSFTAATMTRGELQYLQRVGNDWFALWHGAFAVLARSTDDGSTFTELPRPPSRRNPVTLAAGGGVLLAQFSTSGSIPTTPSGRSSSAAAWSRSLYPPPVHAFVSHDLGRTWLEEGSDGVVYPLDTSGRLGGGVSVKDSSALSRPSAFEIIAVEGPNRLRSDLQLTSDGGRTWRSAKDGFPSLVRYPGLIDAYAGCFTPRRMFATSDQAAWRADISGGPWTQLESSGTPLGLGCDGTHVYVDTKDGFFGSEDEGQTFHRLGPTPNPAETQEQVVARGAEILVLLTGGQPGVFLRSTDGGAHFAPFDGPPSIVHSSLVLDGDRFLVGTDDGIFALAP